MALDPVRFARLRPVLWHLTAASNLPAIRRDGALLSPARLAPGSDAVTRGRVTLTPVESAGRGCVILRDQQPLRESAFALADGYRFEDLLSSMNDRVFFWQGDPDGPIAYGRRHFAKYDGTDIAVLRVPTAPLLSRASVELSRVNSGAAGRYPGQSRRGPDTFTPAAAWAHTPGAVVEVTVRDRVVLPTGTQVSHGTDGPFTPL